MKNFKLAIIALFAVAISSCSDDDGPSYSFNQENLAGTYNIVFYEEVTTENFSVGGTTATSRTEIEGSSFTNAQIIFNSNGTFSWTGLYDVSETTFLQGQEVSSTDYIDEFDESGSFSIDEEERTINLNQSDFIFEVSRFSESSFRLMENFEDADGSFQAEIRLERVN